MRDKTTAEYQVCGGARSEKKERILTLCFNFSSGRIFGLNNSRRGPRPDGSFGGDLIFLLVSLTFESEPSGLMGQAGGVALGAGHSSAVYILLETFSGKSVRDLAGLGAENDWSEYIPWNGYGAAGSEKRMGG